MSPRRAAELVKIGANNDNPFAAANLAFYAVRPVLAILLAGSSTNALLRLLRGFLTLSREQVSHSTSITCNGAPRRLETP
jgi:hypothetical protein